MKKCDVQDCTYPVFGTDKNTGKRYCKNHQHLRTDIIRNIKHKGVKGRNELLIRNKLGFNVFLWGFEDEATMFDQIWMNRPHVSQVSGKSLENVSLYYAMFAHVLPKGKYPLFRYNPDNIILVHPLEHVLIDQGSSSARRNYEKKNPTANFSLFYTKKEKLLQEYPREERNHGGQRNVV